MNLRKNRKAMPYFGESQPIGCLKVHCTFMQRKPRHHESVNRVNSKLTDQFVGDFNFSSERKVTAVGSLVANFERESGSDLMSIISPQTRGHQRIVTVKSLEDIRLEKVQAESAAYYSYNDVPRNYHNFKQADTIRQRMIVKNPERIVTTLQKDKRLGECQLVLTAEKGRKIARRKFYTTNKQVSASPSTVCEASTRKILPSTQSDISSIKIKTLEEIRAERKAKERIHEEQEVTSTLMDLDMAPTSKPESVQDVKKKIVLRRQLPQIDKINIDGNSRHSSERSISAKVLHCIEIDVMSDVASNIDENLLLEDDDDDEDMVLLKPEEELLNEIEDYLDITP